MNTNAFSFFNSDVATRFETNFRERRPNSSASVLEFLHRLGSNPDMIAHAFLWENTPEGTGYWETINILWKRFLKVGGKPLSEDLDINNLDVEELKLQERFEAILETRPKLRPKDILEEFAELFGEQILYLFKQNFEKFSRRNRDREGQNLEEYLQKQIEYLTVDCMVARSFTFCSTPEGDEYWRKIDDMWKQYWAARSAMRVK